MAKKTKVKIKVEAETFVERWEKKSSEDKKWNLLQIAWMVGAIIIAFALLINMMATVMTASGAAVIFFALRELGKMKKTTATTK